tara:strand:+ start:472 stop:1068 length:597 start_codon:yes stop_codon:yes gene_type:complete
MEEKQCSVCNEVKPESEYYPRRGWCKSCHKIKNNKYYNGNRETVKAQKQEYNKRNAVKQAAQGAEWRKNNPEYNKKYHDKWRTDNRDKVNEYYRERMRDPLVKLKHRARVRIREILGSVKDKTTPEYLGCSFEELVIHIEEQFTEGMTWENMSEWHIDHIIPLFEGKTLEQVIPLFHYSNLQPLWATDNLQKGKRLDS